MGSSGRAPSSASSIGGYANRGEMESNYVSVREQTWLKAGNGGFLINVEGNTTLIGSVISSSEQAAVDGLNYLSACTLVVKEINNHAVSLIS